MIEVFKTSVCDATNALRIIEKLQSRFPAWQINFDLTDCDRILRVKAAGTICIDSVAEIVTDFGFDISVLEDIPAFFHRENA